MMLVTKFFLCSLFVGSNSEGSSNNELTIALAEAPKADSPHVFVMLPVAQPRSACRAICPGLPS